MATKTTAKKNTKKTAVKKVAKKTAARKTTKNTRRTSKIEKRPLVVAADMHAFWVTDGTILDSLQTLQEALSVMEKSVYAYHVTEEKNDFVNWVRDVLQDDLCACDLQSASTPKKAKTIVTRHLKKYSL